MRPSGDGEMRVALPEGGQLVVQIRISPYFTGLAGVYEVIAGLPRGCPRRWVEYVEAALTGFDLSPFEPLTCANGLTVPDLFAPLPLPGAQTIEDEIRRLRATPPDIVTAEVRATYPDEVPPPCRPYLDDPSRALRRYCDCFLAYWERVYAPLWGRMQADLEREALTLAHALALEGVEALFARLYPLVDLDEGYLHVLHARRTMERELGGRMVLLVPMACGQDATFTGLDQPEAVVIGYGAGGLGDLWNDLLTGPPPDSALEALLGGSRAQLLAKLEQPATTSGLATTLGLSPATVSHHLAALARAGLVDGARLGARVYYRLTSRGRHLRGLYLSGS